MASRKVVVCTTMNRSTAQAVLMLVVVTALAVWRIGHKAAPGKNAGPDPNFERT